jgi:cytochrome c oxidase subunit IV
MSTGTHSEPAAEPEMHGAAGPQEPGHESHQQAHPSDRQYVIIALILAVLTALEVSTYFAEELTGLLIGALFGMMVAKFAIVCGYFMHLRYDNPLFRRVFVFGLVLAVSVYVAALTTMQFWSDPSGA